MSYETHAVSWVKVKGAKDESLADQSTQPQTQKSNRKKSFHSKQDGGPMVPKTAPPTTAPNSDNFIWTNILCVRIFKRI